MRRGVGIGAINKKALEKAKFETKASEITTNELTQLTQQMERFKTNLEEYRSRKNSQINHDKEVLKEC